MSRLNNGESIKTASFFSQFNIYCYARTRVEQSLQQKRETLRFLFNIFIDCELVTSFYYDLRLP